jgi:ribosomal protein S18 acetylase RimI-like enzyme
MVTPAGPGDALALAQVHVRAWRETYPGMLPQTYLDRMSAEAHAARWAWRLMHSAEVTLAAEGPDGLVGYASGEASGRGGAGGPEAEITTLYVLRRAQRAGVGSRLLTGMARTLAAQGATSLIIWVLRDNLLARGFYEAMGGVLAGERLERVGGWSVPSVGYRWGDIRVMC